MKKTTILMLISFLIIGMTNAQEKTTMNVKDLNSQIEKYIEKNYKEFQTVEAYKYETIYEVKIQKAAEHESLVFDKEGKFLHKKTDADKAKFALQTRFTMSLDDVESDINKYVKKNHEGYKMTEAFRYDEVFTVKIMKGNDTETLVFDKEGKFIKKVMPAAPAAHAADSTAKPATQTPKTDSVPSKAAVIEEAAPTIAPTDSTKQ